jgi:thiol-disulfide isomerase/thioredoxin
MIDLGSPLPAFDLPDTEGRRVKETDFSESSCLLVMFICNHCPFVKHIRLELARFSRDYQGSSLAIVAVNSNDIEAFPEDGMEAMREEVAEVGYLFPYLLDETQEVAKSFRAACTPDFFLYDKDRKLAYRGQFDGSRPGNDIPVTGKDLRKSVDLLVSGGRVPEMQAPSVGCNIKWKKGNQPEYFIE